MLFPKTGNVLNAILKSVQAKAKGYLHTTFGGQKVRVATEVTLGFFVTTYNVKYDKVVGKLAKVSYSPIVGQDLA